MFKGFERRETKVPDRGFGSARIHLRHGRNGPPLLLLHGNPLSHVSSHKIAEPLAERFHVVATDLRGYGDSVGPEEGGENHIDYSFRPMAQEVDVMAALGYDRFQVAGHDRGARRTHLMCLDHADKVERAAVIDILPSRHIWSNATYKWAIKSWHWLFMAQPYDMDKKLSKPGLAPFAPEAFEEYVRCFD